MREAGAIVLGAVDEAGAALARHAELLRGDAAGAVRFVADNATAAMSEVEASLRRQLADIRASFPQTAREAAAVATAALGEARADMRTGVEAAASPVSRRCATRPPPR